MNRTLLIALTMAMFAPNVSFAQDEETDAETGRVIKYKERTEIDFEAVDVTGELVKPEGSLLLDRKRASFNPLIQLRENFDAEMQQSVDEIK